jgi:hypothetical protein
LLVLPRVTRGSRGRVIVAVAGGMHAQSTLSD